MWDLNRLYCESGDNATQSARLVAMKTHEPWFSEKKQGSCPVAIPVNQFRTPLQTLAASMALSGFSFLAFSSRTSVVSG